jgi:hypothetical protein
MAQDLPSPEYRLPRAWISCMHGHVLLLAYQGIMGQSSGSRLGRHHGAPVTARRPDHSHGLPQNHPFRGNADIPAVGDSDMQRIRRIQGMRILSPGAYGEELAARMRR